MEKWKEVKKNIQSLSEKDKIEIELMADIVSSVIRRRHELGLSQRELEKLTGIKQSAICRMEKMQHMPQLDTVIKIMEPLGLKLSVTKM